MVRRNKNRSPLFPGFGPKDDFQLTGALCYVEANYLCISCHATPNNPVVKLSATS